MKKIFLVFMTTVAAVLAGCSSNPPVVDYDSSVDFASYKTFAFLSDHPLMRSEGSTPGSPLLESRLMRVTQDYLVAKGYQIVANPEEADFAIGFTTGARDKIKVNSYPEPYRPYYGGWGWGGGYYGGYGGGSNVDVQQYVEGTLALDIYDVSEHKPAWHGVATKRITDSMRRNPDESITEIVHAILEGFPPGSMPQ